MTKGKQLLIGYACAIGAVILWGFHPVVIRVLIKDGVDPYLIGSMRLFIGSAILSIVALILSAIKRQSYPNINYSKFFWITAISLAANFILFHKGLEFTIASDAILLEAFSPVMVLIIVMIFIPHRIKNIIDYPNLMQTVAIVIIAGSVGSALLLSNNPLGQTIDYNKKLIGDIIEFIAMFAWALVMIGMSEYQKAGENKNVLAYTSQFFFIAAIIMSPFVPWKELSTLQSDQWFWIMILSIFSTGLTYVLWITASKYLEIIPLVTIFNFASIFNVVIESFVFDIAITWNLFLGGALILYSAVRSRLLNEKYKILMKEEPPI